MTLAVRPIRVLTLHRPWGWCFFNLPPDERKELENRSWAPSPLQLRVGERFALHHGKKFDEEGAEYIRETLERVLLPQEAFLEGVLGTVRYNGTVEVRNDIIPDYCPEDQRRWCFGPFAWKTPDAMSFPMPIPWRGAQGLWTAPPELAEQIRRLDPELSKGAR